MRLLFFGSGGFGLPTLESLCEAHDVLAVVSQPDRPAGRRRKLTPTPISQFALDAGLPLHRIDNVNATEAAEQLRQYQADAWVVIAFGQKLSDALLDGQTAINLHASLLPRWRGAAPIHHAIMAGDAVTGVSVITLASRMDAGAVLGCDEVSIGPSETTGELHDRLARLGPSVVASVLDQIATDCVDAGEQDEGLVTHASKLSRAAASVSPTLFADQMRGMINGYSPWPGVSIDIGGEPIRLLEAAPTEAETPQGTLTAHGVLGCAEGSVHLLEVQPPGGRPTDFGAWARGESCEWPVTYPGQGPP